MSLGLIVVYLLHFCVYNNALVSERIFRGVLWSRSRGIAGLNLAALRSSGDSQEPSDAFNPVKIVQDADTNINFMEHFRNVSISRGGRFSAGEIAALASEVDFRRKVSYFQAFLRSHIHHSF